MDAPDQGSTGGHSARIRRARPRDAEAWVRCHLEAMAHAYAVIMPPEFFDLQRGRVPERVDDLREALSLAGRDPDTGHGAWVAEDDLGMVAVAESVRGPAQWERDRDLSAAGPQLQLRTLYCLPRGHGTGVGQALLERAVGDRPAYLWLVGGNARAGSFYRRNGFVPDGLEIAGGPTWFARPMIRHIRPGPLH